jgi:hypothetical protein
LPIASAGCAANIAHQVCGGRLRNSGSRVEITAAKNMTVTASTRAKANRWVKSIANGTDTRLRSTSATTSQTSVRQRLRDASDLWRLALQVGWIDAECSSQAFDRVHSRAAAGLESANRAQADT